MARLPRKFYEHSTLKVAPELLGQFLVRQVTSNKEQVTKRKTIITEVEAYVGEGDPACHASRGMTERNKVMYGEAGRAYVYFVYGMYYCLNIVTEGIGFPAAVLVRGVVPIKSKVPPSPAFGRLRRAGAGQKSKIFDGQMTADSGRLDGPGKLCRELGITKEQNGTDLVRGRELWIERNPRRDEFIKSHRIKRTPRVGIREGKEKLWRWVAGTARDA